jgi:hypothetical protein
MKKYFSQLSYLLFTLAMFIQTAGAAVVYPVETDELLKNPGKGWMTMFKAAINDKHLPADIPSSLYYLRINWEEVHTGPDEYNWNPIDQAIREAQKGGQQIMIRLMPIWEKGNSPLWMKDLGFRGYQCNLKGIKWVADLDDPHVQVQISKLIQEMGARYDQNPGVYGVEINLLGIYGEGHFNNCPDIPMPKEKTQQWLADVHYANFPHQPIIGPIDSSRGKEITRYMYEKYGHAHGAGIFMDAWGDYSRRYDHMEVKYPKWLTVIHGSEFWDSWERGIIKLEPSNIMNQWRNDIPRSLQWALDRHASFIGNKNAEFPYDYKDKIRTALKRLGYRLVLRKLEHSDPVSKGSTMRIKLEFENIGVAPPYRDYYLAFQLRGSKTETYVSNKSIKFWLPGKHNEQISFAIPKTLPPGNYEIAIGIVSPFDQQPIIQMPIRGKDGGGWYPLSKVFISND